MRICVVGAGIAGLACAYHLVRDGHEVVVVDSGTQVGSGTSKANGGQLSYSYVSPLAAPGALRKAASWMLDGEAPLRMRLQSDPKLWRWLISFARACRQDVFERSTREMLTLAYHSRDVLARMLQEHQLDFSYRQNGKLVVFRSEAELNAAAAVVQLQAAHGAKQQVLDAAGCLALEPALRDVAGQLAGGVYTPDEAVGDAFALCAALQQSLVADGKARFRLGERIDALEQSNGKITAARATKGAIQADHFVLANGIGAMELADTLGITLPLYPLKGYSLTTPVRPTDLPPRISITDAHHKVVYALLDEPDAGGAEGRLRVAGMVDLVGFGTELASGRVDLLERQAKSVFPAAGDWSRSEKWAGLRPATPDWKPVFGSSGYGNLWLDVGLGGLGFTLGCGTGEVLAALIAGRETAIPTSPYALGRRNEA